MCEAYGQQVRVTGEWLLLIIMTATCVCWTGQKTKKKYCKESLKSRRRRSVKCYVSNCFTFDWIELVKPLPAFAVAGPMFWNRLPPEIRANDSLQSFKSQLKTYYFSL